MAPANTLNFYVYCSKQNQWNMVYKIRELHISENPIIATATSTCFPLIKVHWPKYHCQRFTTAYRHRAADSEWNELQLWAEAKNGWVHSTWEAWMCNSGYVYSACFPFWSNGFIKAIKLGMPMRMLKNLQPRFNFIKKKTHPSRSALWVASATFWGVDREMQEYFISYLSGMHL